MRKRFFLIRNASSLIDADICSIIIYYMLRKVLMLTGFVCSVIPSLAQNDKKIFHDDSLSPTHKYLPDITVVGRNSKSDYQQLPEVVGTSIYAGKKNASKRGTYEILETHVLGFTPFMVRVQYKDRVTHVSPESLERIA